MRGAHALTGVGSCLLGGLLSWGCGPIVASVVLLDGDDDRDPVPTALSLTQPPDDNFDVALEIFVQDPDTASVELEVRWRDVNDTSGTREGPITFDPQQTTPGYPHVASGRATVLWDSGTDVGFGNNQLVEITVMARDGGSETKVVSQPFRLSNGPLGDAQTHATILRPDGTTSGDATADDLPDLIVCGTGDLDERGRIALIRNASQTFSPAVLVDCPDVPGAGVGVVNSATNHFSTPYAHPSECVLVDSTGDGKDDVLVVADAPHATWTFNDLVSNLGSLLGGGTSALGRALTADAANGFQNVLAHQVLLVTPQDRSDLDLELGGTWISAQAAVADRAPAANPGPALSGGDPTRDTVGWFVMDLVAADLDGVAAVGTQDLVIVHGVAQLSDLVPSPSGAPRGAVVIRQVDATGQWGRAFYLDPTVMGVFPTHAVVADVDANGLPDVVVACQGTGNGDASLAIYLQTLSASAPGVTAPTFRGVSLALSTLRGAAFGGPVGSQVGGSETGVGVAAGDVDGDGKTDLVVLGQSPTDPTDPRRGPLAFVVSHDAAYVSLPDLPGLGLAQALVLPEQLQVGRAAVADVDNDGGLDLLVPAPQINEVLLYAGRKQPGAGQPPLTGIPARFTASFQPALVQVRDFNGDQRADVVATNIFSRDVSVFYQTSRGTLFQLPDPVFTDREPFLMASGDLNGDGREEVVCSMAGPNQVHVFEADAERGLRLAQVHDLGASAVFLPDPFAPSLPVFPAVVEATHDGRPDLLIAIEQGVAGGAVKGAWGLVAGPLTLDDPTPRPLDLVHRSDFPPIGFSAAAGDFLGGDGVPDVLLTHPNWQGINLYRGDGDGSFTKVTPLSTVGVPGARSPVLPTQAVVVDFDADGDQDLVIGNAAAGAGQLLVYYGQDGALPAMPQLIDTYADQGQVANPSDGSGESFSIAVGLLDPNDDLPDVVLPGFNQPELGLLIQRRVGSGREFVPVRLPTGSKPSQVAIGDLNDDGRPDIAVTWQDEDKLAVYYQNADFTPGGDLRLLYFGATLFDTPDQPVGVAIADLNGDGRNDLALSSRATNSLAVFFQR